MNKSVILGVLVFSLVWVNGCGDLGDEPPAVPLVRLLPGSPGYEGDGAVHGLLNGEYLVKHQKKETLQEKDPTGKVWTRHEEDWYAVGAEGTTEKIASSTAGEIPASAGTESLNKGTAPNHSDKTDFYDNRYSKFALNSITGLVNGETYGVYRYAELANGDNVGRYRGRLQTENVNAVVNLKGMSAGQSIGLFDEGSVGANGVTGPLNDNNRLVVLVNTGLSWTEKPQSLIGNAASNPTIRMDGYDYDIVIEKLNALEGNVSVAAVETEGQRYFILTGSSDFRGHIRLTAKN
jgi:hypothetical protein